MKFTLIFVLFFLGFNISAQVVPKEDSTLYVIAFWNKSDTAVFDVINKREIIKNSDTIIEYAHYYHFKVTVVDSTENNYVIKCDYVMDSIYYRNPQRPYATEFTENRTLLIETDYLGSFIEVRNWEEVAANKIKAIDRLKSNLIPTDEETIKLIEETKKTLCNKEGINLYAIDDIGQLLMFNGSELILGEVYEMEENFSINFISKEIASKRSIVFDSLFYEDYIAEISSSIEIDTVQLKNELGNYFKEKKINAENFSLGEYMNRINEIAYYSKLSGWVVHSKKIIEYKGSDYKWIKNLSIWQRLND